MSTDAVRQPLLQNVEGDKRASEDGFARQISPSGKKRLRHPPTITPGHYFTDQAPPACTSETPSELDEPVASQNFVAAVLCCFLSVTGGVSLGGILFPSDEDNPNTAYQVAGMQMGLLAACVSSWVAYFRSQVPCGVSGGMFPPVVALSASYFKGLGAENPVTILFTLPLITTINGLLLYLAARLPLEQMVKGIPYIVFGGFMAGTGVVCIQCGLEMAAGWQIESHSGEFFSAWVFWCPPLLVAILVHLGQNFGAPKKEILLPVALLLTGVSFYAVRWLCMIDADLASARVDGWLYNIEVPQSPGFYKVWSLQDISNVRWELLMDSSLLAAVVNMFCLSVLCIVEDLYGVVEYAHFKISMKREVETAAFMNVLNGLAGSMPTNLVMSYSITAFKSGATSRVFLLYLSAISTIFFMLADYIISVMPKMVPAAAMIWVGIAMCWDWIYLGFTKLSRQDYFVLWTLILLDVFKGPETMIVAGLCVTSMQLAYRLSAIEVFEQEFTSANERSPTLYPVGKDQLFEERGESTMILHLAKGLLFFGSAFQIQERVEEHLHRPDAFDEPLRFLVLDLSQIEDAEVSGIKVLHFIVSELAKGHNFTVVFVGMLPALQRQLQHFGTFTGVTRTFSKMHEALRFVEEQLFNFFGGAGILDLGTKLNPSIAAVRNDVEHICGKSDFIAVAVDVHSWLNNYISERYVPDKFLPCLLNALTRKQYVEGDTIFNTLTANAAARPCDFDERTPLIWVLAGEVHLSCVAFTGNWGKEGPNGPVEIRGAGKSKHVGGDLLQIADVASGELGCAGPLMTYEHFFFALQIPPITACAVSKEVTVAVLTYSKFLALPQDVAQIFQNYCGRKKMSFNALTRA